MSIASFTASAVIFSARFSDPATGDCRQRMVSGLMDQFPAGGGVDRDLFQVRAPNDIAT